MIIIFVIIIFVIIILVMLSFMRDGLRSFIVVIFIAMSMSAM